jgi:hypothetical protein
MRRYHLVATALFGLSLAVLAELVTDADATAAEAQFRH